MSGPVSLSPALRLADLADRHEVARIEAWLRVRADATPFHRPAWIMAVETGTGQAAHMLLAEDAGGAIAGLLPLTLVHSPLFGRALVSSGFAVGGGILADSPRIAAALAAEMVALAARWSAPTAELRGGVLPRETGAGHGWHVKADTYLGFTRDLPADAEAIMNAIPRKQRAELRKGLANGLSVRIGRDARDRADHYAVYAESVRNLGTPVFPRSLFDGVLDAFGADADIVTVSDGDTPLASVLSLYHGGAVMPYWGGGSFAARGARANEVMYHALMLHAAARGCTRFDFGRSKAGTGPAAYKKNWGFEGQPLAYAVHSADGAPPRDINPLSPRYRLQVGLWRKLPLGIANRIGPWIARGLG